MCLQSVGRVKSSSMSSNYLQQQLGTGSLRPIISVPPDPFDNVIVFISYPSSVDGADLRQCSNIHRISSSLAICFQSKSTMFILLLQFFVPS